MSNSSLPPELSKISQANQILRDFGDYSLSFPCNPHELHSAAHGFRILVWSNFLFVAGILLLTGTIYYFSHTSEQFQTFCETMTVERIEALQSMQASEQIELFEKELPIQQMAPPFTVVFLALAGGLILNIFGTCFCMSCPPTILPNAWAYGLAWYGALLASSIPIIGPLLLLFAWNFWLTFLMRLLILLGEQKGLELLRKIHRTVFYCILAFLGTTFSSDLANSGQLGAFAAQAFSIAIFVFLVLGFIHYARVLTLLRTTIQKMERMWDFGSEEFRKKSQAGTKA